MIHYKHFFENLLLTEAIDTQLEAEVQKLEDSLKRKYPQLEDLSMYIQRNNKSLYLADIRIYDEYKGQGFGSKVMTEILHFADSKGLPMVLIPEPDGRKKEKLLQFYKKFGFKPNTGKYANYSLSIPGAFSLFREPKIQN